MSENSGQDYKYPPDLQTPVRPWWQRLIAIAIIAALLLTGLALAQYLFKTRPIAKRKPPAKMRALVKTTTINHVSQRVTVSALGFVGPAAELNMQARVSGTVIDLNPSLVPGGIIKQGEVVIRLDDADYQLNLRLKLDKLAQAKADLRLEEGNQLVAGQEWQMINDEGIITGEADLDLALRKPQLDKAMADVKLAETEVEQARLDLARTEISAPFNCVVLEKNVAIGSQITPQSSIATLTGTDTFWAEISVPIDQLKWLTLPDGKKPGSAVTVYTNDKSRHRGLLLKLLPDVDKDGLMARLLIEISDPLGLTTSQTPLFLGSFIRAEIAGQMLDKIFMVPRAALFENDNVLTVTNADTLHIQPVEVVWKNREFAFLGAGLNAGDEIIISNVSAPIEGMALDVDHSNPENMTEITSPIDAHAR